MKKIVVISDTHGSLIAWKKAENFFADADLVLHAGDVLYNGARNPLPEGYDTMGLVESITEFDGNLLMVKGNVDSRVDDWVLPYPLSEYSVVEDNGLRIVIYHGYQHQTDDERFDFARRFGADILIFGHTHIPLLKEKDGIILLNPGSASLPKQDPPAPTLATIGDGIIRIYKLENGEEIDSISMI